MLNKLPIRQIYKMSTSRMNHMTLITLYTCINSLSFQQNIYVPLKTNRKSTAQSIQVTHPFYIFNEELAAHLVKHKYLQTHAEPNIYLLPSRRKGIMIAVTVLYFIITANEPQAID